MNPAKAIQQAIALNVTDTAALLGESRPQFSRYVNGRQSPSADRVARWCAASGVTLAAGADGWTVIMEVRW